MREQAGDAVSMKYRAFLTHNPQDFFDGFEDPELTEVVEISDADDIKAIREILNQVNEGYKAIIFPREGVL